MVNGAILYQPLPDIRFVLKYLGVKRFEELPGMKHINIQERWWVVDALGGWVCTQIDRLITNSEVALPMVHC